MAAEPEDVDVDEPLPKKQRTERRGIHWASNDRLEQIKLFFVERDERRPRKKSRLSNTHQLIQADISWDTPPRMFSTSHLSLGVALCSYIVYFSRP